MRFAFSIALIFLLTLPPLLAMEGGGDGRITFYAYHLGESAGIRYREGGRYLPEGLKKIESVFRSRDSDKTHPIDPRLLDLIDAVEDHFSVRQVEVISGYRSQAFNRELKATGHSVANESLHTQGRAADIHLDEITEETLKEYAESLQAGGVGFYPSLHMVHVDVGPVRTWGEPAPRKKWVGEKNEAVPVLLTVSPDRSVGEKRLENLKIEGGEIERDLEIEFFDRGRWAVVGQIDSRVSLREQRGVFEKLPWGKFRLKAKVSGRPDGHQYSNEFYFKRI